MRPSDDLFLLIKSLSPAEKRYFKLFTEQHVIGKQNNYMLLFEAISKQKEYNEEAIKKRFRKEKFVKQLTFTKNTLTNKILKSLRAYYAGSKRRSIEFDLYESLDTLEILYQKKLLNAFRKELKRAKKTAYQYEKYRILLKLIAWEREFNIRQQEKQTFAHAEKIMEEEKKILEYMQNDIEFQNLAEYVLLNLNRKLEERDDEKLAEIKKQMEHPLLQDEALALTFMAKLHFNSIWGSYYMMIRDAQKVYDYYKRMVGVYEERPLMLEARLSHYGKTLGNFLNACFFIHNMEEHKQTIDKIKALAHHKASTGDMSYQIFEITCHQELVNYMNTGKFREGVAAAYAMKDELEKYKDRLHASRLLTIYLNMGILHFVANNFSDALHWFNEIVYHPKADSRKDVQQLGKVLVLLVHYDLDNIEILENLHRSAYRSLKAQNALNPLEKLILHHFKKLININIFDKKAIVKCFEAFLEEIKELPKKSNYTSNSLGLTEVRYWVRSKLENCSFGEVVLSEMAKNKARKTK